MSLLQVAAELFISKMKDGGGLDVDGVAGALSALLPTSGGELDLQALAGKFLDQGGGLAGLASSWLGDGGNDALDPSQLLDLLGGDAVGAFAQQIGVGESDAASGLAEMIPALIDRGSSGGAVSTDLLKSVGGSLLGKLF